MFKAARLFSMAAMAFLLVSGTTAPTFAASDAGKKKVTHASKTAPKSASRRGAPGGGSPVYPSSTSYSY